MELRHLRYFVAVAEEMNVHRAAARLHISQPPLSLAIQQLEEEIGTSLFTRQGRGIQITRAGETLLEKACAILEQARQAAETTRLVGEGKSGTLKIGFISSAISGILQQTVAAYRSACPDVILHLEQSVSSQMEQRLLAREIDIGLIRLPEYISDEIDVQEAAKESWMAALPARHPLAKKKNVRIPDLASERLIFYPRWNSPAGYDAMMQLFERHGVTPHIHQEAPEQMTIAALVAAGMGIGLVPECMARLRLPGIIHKPIAGTRNKTGFAFIARKDGELLVKSFLSVAKNAMTGA